MAFRSKRERRVLVNLRNCIANHTEWKVKPGLIVRSGFLLLLLALPLQQNARPFLNVPPKENDPG
jgi:hypothetical protein